MIRAPLPDARKTRDWDEPCFRWPIWRGSEPGPDDATVANRVSGASNGLLEGKPRPLSILVIEDNRDYAESLQTFFELFGHMAAVAYSGPEGLEAALGGGYDAIVCDLGLPGISGFELVRRLRQEPKMKNIYIIAVTGYGSDQDLEEAAECGFDAHLVKPVQAMDILKKLQDGTRRSAGN